MGSGNLSSITEFILVGLTNHRKTQVLIFVVFLLIYFLSLIGNLAIIVLVRTDASLQTPMYFFLLHLAVLETLNINFCMPLMLAHLLSGNGAISFNLCMVQMFLVMCLGSAECFLLGAMAYDRYLAICHPLLYVIAMGRWRQVQLASASWASGFLLASINGCFTLRLPFCGPNHINHFFCDMPVMIKLACGDIQETELNITVVSALIILLPFLIILISYMLILSSVIKMQSATGWRKAFSTCASHLTVVILTYSMLIITYLSSGSGPSPDRDKGLAVFYTVLTPLLNPVIYTLRNKDFHGAASRMLQRRGFKQER